MVDRGRRRWKRENNLRMEIKFYYFPLDTFFSFHSKTFYYSKSHHSNSIYFRLNEEIVQKGNSIFCVLKLVFSSRHLDSPTAKWKMNEAAVGDGEINSKVSRHYQEMNSFDWKIIWRKKIGDRKFVMKFRIILKGCRLTTYETTNWWFHVFFNNQSFIKVRSPWYRKAFSTNLVISRIILILKNQQKSF